MKIITTRLPSAEKALIGHDIPVDLFKNSNSGAIGIYVEQILTDLGYIMNPSTGPDFPIIQVEVKSRAKEAVSAHTVGSMHIDDIIRTPYTRSNIRDKFQLQFRVSYSRAFCKFTNAKVYNFTPDYIQSIIEESYESARTLLTIQYQNYLNNSNDHLSAYVRGLNSNGDLCTGYFENTNKFKNKLYEFRLADSDMKAIENMSKSAKSLKSLFETE